MKRIRIAMSLFFLVVGSAAAQQDLVFYSQFNVNPPGQPYEFDWTIYAGSEETLPIECDCTMTTVSGDPYQGFVTTSFTFHVVNPVTTFLIGVLVPGGGIANCSEPVSGVSKSYIAETVDLSTGIDLAGVGNNIDINWIYISPAGGYTVYNRGDGWQTYCDGIQIEVNPRKSIAPC